MESSRTLQTATCAERLSEYDTSRPAPHLCAADGDPRTIDRRGVTVGTHHSCDVVLSDRYVSGRHLHLKRESQGVRICDLGSRNGSFFDGRRVQDALLDRPGRLQVGRSRLAVMFFSPGHNPGGMIGEHVSMQRLYRTIERYALEQCPVLVCGETGTGKELVARGIHELSPRRSRRFEALNCAAIPGELAESELFGHVRGAFTGASRDYDGAFVRASGGTLFLDEIGEMPRAIQAKLLRVLETARVRPVGASKSVDVDFRIVAATHRDLATDVAKGRFREDLFYRLAVGTLCIPPLRERGEDIERLANHFLKLEGFVGQLAPAAVQAISQHRWPGNIRALRHAVQRAVALGANPAEVGRHLTPVASTVRVDAGEMIRYRGRGFGDIRREIYERVLADCAGNRAAAAVALQLPKSTFYDQLRAMEI